MVSTGLHMTELSVKLKEKYSDIDISVFTANNSRNQFQHSSKSKELYKNIKINRVSNFGKHHGNLIQRLFFSLGFSFKAVYFILKNSKNFDMLLLTTNPPFLGIIAYLINKISKLKYIVIAYDIYPEILVKMGILSNKSLINLLWKWINIKVYNSSEQIISIGDDMTKVIINKMKIKDLNKIKLIHNWSDKNNVFPVKREENNFILNNNLTNKKVILYSGTFGKTHNIEEILKASNELVDFQEILFLFIGGGAKKKIIENHILNSTSSNVILLPFQPFEIISQTLSSASISFVCLDSKFTGLSVPSKAYGILASGTPIIGILDAHSEIGRTIIENECGYVWSPIKGVKLSKLIIQILKDDDHLKKLKSNSLNTFLSKYDISIAVSKYYSVFKSVLNN